MHNRHQQGFTLIEILVVISIIGFITASISVATANARAQGRDARRIQDLDTFKNALEIYFGKYGVYPCAGLAVAGGNFSDGDWLHFNPPDGSFLDSDYIGGTPCSGAPAFGLVTEGLIKSGIQAPSGCCYLYDVTANRGSYILYSEFESSSYMAKMTNDGGLSSCFYEIGVGVGTMSPSWTC